MVEKLAKNFTSHKSLRAQNKPWSVMVLCKNRLEFARELFDSLHFRKQTVVCILVPFFLGQSPEKPSTHDFAHDFFLPFQK